MKTLPVLIVSLAVPCLCYSQQASVKGSILDTLNHQQLSNTVIAVLQAKDSMLYTFTRTDAAGKFELSHLQQGKYLLLATAPGYADYVEPVTLADSAAAAHVKIILSLKSRLLQEVVINQQIAAIKLKGDTTEYNADSFKMQPNATVEDLLKKLPGIQVDKNGQITAQGEKIQKVLVDGEEFFGDDPTLATQNLRADMVDKVQVFDKKSDQAAFTGIDDGEKTKTLNLKLKDSKKNGYFGKAAAGAGNDGFHDSQLMLNLFKQKLKLSGYGIVSNTGKTGLNWNERRNYGGSGDDVSYNEGTDDYTFNFAGDDLENWDGRYSGEGYPLVQTGGLHFNNKWNEDHQSLNGNYKILQLYMDGGSDTRSQYLLPDTLYYTNSSERFANSILRNRADASYELQLDSSSSIKINIDGGLDHKNTHSAYTTQSLAQDSTLVNQNERNITNTGDMRTLNSNILWRKKLRKKGRTLSFNLQERYRENTSDGYLDAITEFYKDGGIENTQRIDQYKTNNTKNTTFDTKLTYTEPLSVASSLIFNYGVIVNNSNSERNSFNQDNNGKYNNLDSVYSSDYVFNTFTHRGGLNYNLVKKKLRANVGGSVGLTSFDQQDMHIGISHKRDFVNWYPAAFISYMLNTQRRLGLNYNGNTRQPGIEQLQPLRTNDDPLNVNIGNPDLKPSFSNNLRLSFSDFKMLTERNIWVSINYTFTDNAITSKSTIDDQGKRTNQSVNVDGNKTAFLYFNYGMKLKKADMRLGYFLNANYSRYANYVNGALNTTNSGGYTNGIYLSKSREKRYDINLEASATYTTSRSSVQQNIQTNYWTAAIGPNVDLFLPWKLQLHTDLNINLRQKTAVFVSNNNVFIWNAWIGKKLFKNDALLIKASVNDLLNENIGFNRQVNSNFISERTYSTIARYVLFSVNWNFNKNGGVKQP
ncbi:outer membrane beta-barrel protein [Chitinophaga agrisoli]|uniref:Outer membrane beta-barrel protein n=1 Tax=Chitinophaga agrisoli TaxID=2607653 RepID=A0A5B2VQJ1_9BACT|nr:outer membrane beta-barrel family protein [Chitinophaga agrisoli]KAA2240399.1 outer membrane beta-barrel protein [Chitinophaga agrisoli]